MKGFLSKFGDIIVFMLLLVIGMILHNSIVSLCITGLIGLYALWKPKNALYFLLIYIPIRPLIMEFAGSLKVITDVIIVFSFLRVIINSRHQWTSIFRLAWFEWALIAYCALGSLSGLLTGVPLIAAIFQTRAFLLLFLLFYIVRRLGITKEDIKKFLWITFFMAMVLSLQGWIEKVSIRSWLLPYDWSMMPLSSTNRIRIYGLTDNPNTLGIFLMFAYLSILYLRTFYSGKIKRMLSVGLIIALGTCFLTFSRGVFLAFIFSSVLYMILTKARWAFIKRTVIHVVIAIIVVVLPIMILTNIMDHTALGKTQHDIMAKYDQSDVSASDRLTGTFDSEQMSRYAKTGRLYYVKKGFMIFKDHPIIGSGFDTFGDSATLSYPSPIYEKYHIGDGIHVYSDNQYIQVIAQTGIIGMVLFAFFLLNMLFKIWYSRRNEPHLASVILVVLLGIYLSGVYYNIWENDVVDLYFFPMLAVLLPLRKDSEQVK